MEPIDLTMDARTFAAVAMFAAKKDVRTYLNGLCIDTGPNGAYAIGCNGHALAVHKIDDTPRQAAQVIIPADTMALAAKVRTGNLTIHLGAIEGKFDGQIKRKGEIRSAKGSFLFEEIDGIYPDWRRVAKHTSEDKIAFYHPDYVALVHEASNMIHKAKLLPTLIRPGGNGCGFAQLGIDGKTAAWVMPLHGTSFELPSHPGFTI